MRTLPELSPSNEDLAARAQQGCLPSFEELLRRFQVPLLHFLRRVGPEYDAEDVLQETFLRAYSRLSHFRPQWRFSTWLFTIARRTSINYHRRASPATNHDMLLRVVSPAAGPEQTRLLPRTVNICGRSPRGSSRRRAGGPLAALRGGNARRGDRRGVGPLYGCGQDDDVSGPQEAPAISRPVGAGRATRTAVKSGGGTPWLIEKETIRSTLWPSRCGARRNVSRPQFSEGPARAAARRPSACAAGIGPANLAAKAPRRSPELGDRDRNVDRAAGRPGPCLSHSGTAPRPSDRPDFAPRGGQPAADELASTAALVESTATGLGQWMAATVDDNQWAGLDRDAQTAMATVAGSLPFDLSLAIAATDSPEGESRAP